MLKRSTLKATLLTLAVFALAGCANTNPLPQRTIPTPAQLAAQVCPPVRIAIASLQALPDLPAEAQADLAKASPIVADVCAADATVDTVNLQALAQAAMPALLGIVKASTLSADDQKEMVLGLAAAQIVLTAVTDMQGNAQPVPAPPVK